MSDRRLRVQFSRRCPTRLVRAPPYWTGRVTRKVVKAFFRNYTGANGLLIDRMHDHQEVRSDLKMLGDSHPSQPFWSEACLHSKGQLLTLAFRLDGLTILSIVPTAATTSQG